MKRAIFIMMTTEKSGKDNSGNHADSSALSSPKFSGNQLSSYAVPISIIVAGLLIALAIYFSGGRFPISQKTQKAEEGNTAPSPTGTLPVGGRDIQVSDDDHIRGNKDAKVTLVEFSDLQCPFCRKFHPTVKQLLSAYPDQVRWVYKHFPLDTIHSEARPAAEASECVWEQKGDDGFWRFVDGVFENQERIGSQLYRELAQEIGVNMGQFESCISSRKYQQKVEDDYQKGLAAGVRGTPGSFMNGREIPGAVPYSELESTLKSLLGK